MSKIADNPEYRLKKPKVPPVVHIPQFANRCSSQNLKSSHEALPLRNSLVRVESQVLSLMFESRPGNDLVCDLSSTSLLNCLG